jgi:hypothetical protein
MEQITKTQWEQIQHEQMMEEIENAPRIVDFNYRIKVACVNTHAPDWHIAISELDENIFTDEHWFALTRALKKHIEKYS